MVVNAYVLKELIQIQHIALIASLNVKIVHLIQIAFIA
jgi:hypothetical protein